MNLDCGVISGNTLEIEYYWERDNVTVSTARVLQVHFEWSYTCTVTNLDGMNSATTDVYWLTPINCGKKVYVGLTVAYGGLWKSHQIRDYSIFVKGCQIVTYKRFGTILPTLILPTKNQMRHFAYSTKNMQFLSKATSIFLVTTTLYGGWEPVTYKLSNQNFCVCLFLFKNFNQLM